MRQSLLTRYYGKAHPRMRRESSTAGTPVHAPPTPTGSGPGSVMLSRAEMTLHEVQVGVLSRKIHLIEK